MPHHPLIISSLPGRLRLQGGLLRQPEASRMLTESLLAIPCLISVTANLPAGSLLLRYDIQQNAQADMEKQVVAIIQAPCDQTSCSRPFSSNAKPRPPLRQWNRIAKIGMLASFPLSLLFAATGHKRLHTLTGLAFTVMMTVHAGIYRRQLTR